MGSSLIPTPLAVILPEDDPHCLAATNGGPGASGVGDQAAGGVRPMPPAKLPPKPGTRARRYVQLKPGLLGPRVSYRVDEQHVHPHKIQRNRVSV